MIFAALTALICANLLLLFAIRKQLLQLCVESIRLCRVKYEVRRDEARTALATNVLTFLNMMEEVSMLRQQLDDAHKSEQSTLRTYQDILDRRESRIARLEVELDMTARKYHRLRAAHTEPTT